MFLELRECKVRSNPVSEFKIPLMPSVAYFAGFQLSIDYFYIVRQGIWNLVTDCCNRIERLIWLNNGKTLDTIVIKHKLYAKKDLQQFSG